MTSELEFLRALEGWLREDGHEDPNGVLARVAEAIAHEPQARRRSWWLGLAPLGRSARSLVAAAAVFALVAVLGGMVLLRAASVGPNASPSPGPSASPSPAGTTSPSGPATSPTPIPVDPAAPAMANDEPCSRTLPDGSLAVAATSFHLDDLEHMVLNRDDVGGLDGFEVDIGGQGYHDNVELGTIQVHPPTTCDDSRRFGRIDGYGNVYTDVTSGRQVMFAVHLFWREADAAAWNAAFVDGMAAGAATEGYTWATSPLDGVDGGVLAEHRGPDGTRTWAIFRRGSIVGWVVDLHRLPATDVDVVAAAGRMADRIDAVAAEAARRGAGGLDAAGLLSAPLPLAAYGGLGEGLAWDWFFGGCQDNLERGYVAGDKAAADAITFGRLTGCFAMYAPPPDAPVGDVVRVYSVVTVYGDAAGAAAALEANLTELAARGGTRFDVGSIGDEAIGITTPPGGAYGDASAPADTRVSMRVGTVVLTVCVQGPAGVGRESFIVDLATQLEARVTALLAATD